MTSIIKLFLKSIIWLWIVNLNFFFSLLVPNSVRYWILGTEDTEMDLTVLSLKRFTVKWGRKIHKLNGEVALVRWCDSRGAYKVYGGAETGGRQREGGLENATNEKIFVLNFKGGARTCNIKGPQKVLSLFLKATLFCFIALPLPWLDIDSLTQVTGNKSSYVP